jgi:DNA-directed RNA polymerase subunit omega
MARITVQDCLSKVGNENRFSLIHLAVGRVHQHRDGQPFLVQCKNKEVVATLREIAAGEVNFDNIRDFDRKPKAPAPADQPQEAASEEIVAEKTSPDE